MTWTSPRRTAAQPSVAPGLWEELAGLEYENPGLTRLPGKPARPQALPLETVCIAEVKEVLLASGVNRKQLQSVMRSLRAKLAGREKAPRERAVR